jgi:hypothetical protein
MDYDYKANEAKLRDSMGRRLTTGLFEELKSVETVAPAVFKLSEWKAEYVAIADPTGYKAAMALIGDWDHWLQLVSNPIFKEHLDAWKAEVETKLKSEAVQELRKQAKTAVGTSAAKYLAEKGYAKKEKKQKETLPEVDRSGEDAKRLGLKVVR